VASTLTQQFVRAVCYMNYGNYDYMPEIRCDIPDAEATVDEVSAFNTLQQMGMEFPTEWLHNRYGIPIPQEGDKKLQRPPEPVPAGGGGFGNGNTGKKPSNKVSAMAINDNGEEIIGLADIYARILQQSFAASMNDAADSKNNDSNTGNS